MGAGAGVFVKSYSSTPGVEVASESLASGNRQIKTPTAMDPTPPRESATVTPPRAYVMPPRAWVNHLTLNPVKSGTVYR
jgi:hypothetical protein